MAWTFDQTVGLSLKVGSPKPRNLRVFRQSVADPDANVVTDAEVTAVKPAIQHSIGDALDRSRRC